MTTYLAHVGEVAVRESNIKFAEGRKSEIKKPETGLHGIFTPSTVSIFRIPWEVIQEILKFGSAKSPYLDCRWLIRQDSASRTRRVNYFIQGQ